MTALSLLSIMVEEGQSLSDLSKDLIIYPQTLINVKVQDKKSALKNGKLMKIIQDLEVSLGNDGRILVRPSGRNPWFASWLKPRHKPSATIWSARSSVS